MTLRSLACLLFAASLQAAEVNLAWDPVDDARLAGYELGWGAASGAYDQHQSEAGTTATLTLPDSGTSYIAVRALGSGGEVSAWSNEVAWSAAGADPSPIIPLGQVGLWARAEHLGEGPAPPANPAFGSVGSCVTLDAARTSAMTSTLTGVGVGDLVLALVQRDAMPSLAGVALAGHAMARLGQVRSRRGTFYLEVWGILSPSAYASVNVVAQFSDAAAWGSLVAARWSGVASATPIASACNTAGCSGLAAASTARTAQQITIAQPALVIGLGTDWDRYASHAEANGYALRFANSQGRVGCTRSVQWVYDQMATAGSVGGAANFGASARDRYLSLLLAFPFASTAE